MYLENPARGLSGFHLETCNNRQIICQRNKYWLFDHFKRCAYSRTVLQEVDGDFNKLWKQLQLNR